MTGCQCAMCRADRMVIGTLRVIGASTGIAVLLWIANVMGRTLS